MNIDETISKYKKDGFRHPFALAKVCQDIILYKIVKSGFGNNVTIKGGVVMMNISNDNRRATRDLDLDFIKYSLEDNSIRTFIDKLNHVPDNIKLEITGPIEKMKQEDYEGKRVHIYVIEDTNIKSKFKLDIGVHKNLDLKQEELCFDLNSSLESVSLFVNSKEQIISEKIKSLLKHGVFSTRYKDIFDIYYLINIKTINVEKLKTLIQDYILNDSKMYENTFRDIYNRLNFIFTDEAYKEKLKYEKEDNWLGLPENDVIKKVLGFFKKL